MSDLYPNNLPYSAIHNNLPTAIHNAILKATYLNNTGL